jgi:hypothetical protein
MKARNFIYIFGVFPGLMCIFGLSGLVYSAWTRNSFGAENSLLVCMGSAMYIAVLVAVHNVESITILRCGIALLLICQLIFGQALVFAVLFAVGLDSKISIKLTMLLNIIIIICGFSLLLSPARWLKIR